MRRARCYMLEAAFVGLPSLGDFRPISQRLLYRSGRLCPLARNQIAKPMICDQMNVIYVRGSM
jgi:hypothetical protein